MTLWMHLKAKDLWETVRSDVHRSIGALFDQQEPPRQHLVDPWESPVVRYVAAICVEMLPSSTVAGILGNQIPCILSRARMAEGKKRIAFSGGYPKSALQLQFQVRQTFAEQFGVALGNKGVEDWSAG